MSSDSVSYRSAGVDYGALDAAKRLAMAKALSTSPLLESAGARAEDSSRGEPAFVFELGGRSFAFVVEGLGPSRSSRAKCSTQAGLHPRSAYSTFNMGSGCAIYCPYGEGSAIVTIAERLGLRALRAGRVQKGPREVILEPLEVRFEGAELDLGAVSQRDV